MKMRLVPLLVTEIRRPNPTYRVPRSKIALVKEAGSLYATTKPVDFTDDVFKIAKSLFHQLDREALYVLCLDVKKKIIGINIVSTGSLTQVVVHPREAYKAAVLLNARAVIFTHNHPGGGDPKPSEKDEKLTRLLVLAGMVMFIPVLDHIICTETAYYSFREAGLIEAYEATGRRKLRGI